MKKMITNMKALAALLMVGAAVTSCSSDDSIIDEPDAPQVYTMTVEASKGTNGTRALTDEGTTLTSTWTAGDKVKVYNSSDTELGELTAQTDGASTTLRGTLSSPLSDGATLTLKYLSPSYGTQDGTLTGTENSIDKVCDYATATVTATVSGTSVTTTDASFVNQQAVVKFTLKNKADDSDLNATKLKVSDGTHTVSLTIPDATYTTNGDGVVYVAIPGFSGKTVSLSATVGSDIYTYDRASVTFENGNFYRITVKMTKQAVFTINGSGGKVYFSKGNLQATTTDKGENWTWAFAAHQWDYVGNNAANTAINGNGTVSTNGTVDLFGWSTSSTYNGIHNSTSDIYSGAFVDWGSHSDVIAGIGSGWRTLTSTEWTYLFKTRTATTVNYTDNARYAKAKVNNVHGVILFPDTYTHPTGVTAPTGINATNNAGWSYNKYTAADWAQMEAAGCVFLPAAGGRNGSSVNDVDDNGLYWSSTARNENGAWCVNFSIERLYAGDSSSRYYGFSVRLVRDVVVAP